MEYELYLNKAIFLKINIIYHASLELETETRKFLCSMKARIMGKDRHQKELQ